MTPRSLARMRRAPMLIAALITLGTLTGCDPRQAMYFLQPFDPKIPAEGPSLKGKKVVILATTIPGLSTDFLTLDREMATGLTKILRENVKKIEVVDPSDVAEWVENKPTWTDPAEAAEAFDADVVILLEIRDFRIQDPSSPGLFEGHSTVHIRAVELAYPTDDRDRPITDQPKESNVIYEGERTTTFPVTGHIPLDPGQSATNFRNTFLKLAVKEVSWAFVEHAPGDDMQNSRFNQ